MTAKLTFLLTGQPASTQANPGARRGGIFATAALSARWCNLATIANGYFTDTDVRYEATGACGT